MATSSEANAVYAAGLVQGIVLVTFPAASTIFTDPAQYDLSSTQYGIMFLPQVVTAITTSLLGGGLARRLGSKRVYLVGLLANLVSMALLIVSPVRRRRPDRLWAAACRHGVPGVGFGLTAPTLNTLTAVFHPAGVDTSAGLGCSALLPLTISFGQQQLEVMSASVAGGVIAFYQLGYGIAAFGAGPLQDAGVGLSTIFGFTAVAAVVMGGLSFVLAARQPARPSTRA
jgi:MFS family permease